MSEFHKAPHVDILRSPLSRARGLGSARSGAGEWWASRLTSVALVPLTLWFIWSVIHLSGASYDVMTAWMKSPVVLVMMLALILTTFHHLVHGLQVVIEDYVHKESSKLASLLALKAVAALLCLASVISVVKIGLSA
jgi:succinate dehydrogenase / fumarate reductase membrane anchor subunit